jgi:5S rRNA maturation endonuclease (ribonuclease M5)
MKNGGWLHLMKSVVPVYVPPIKKEPEVVIDAQGMWKLWSDRTPVDRLKSFSQKIGVEAVALIMIGCVWAAPHNAWAFPMHDENQKIIGIRLRNEAGDKWAVKGSRSGVFMPKNTIQPAMNHRIFVVEGATDTAAVLSLNFPVIGRPSCLGCEDMINRIIAKNKIKEVVIISDNDGPGQQGAKKLQSTLKVSSCIWTPSTKDVREFVNHGGTRELVEYEIKNLIWNKK